MDRYSKVKKKYNLALQKDTGIKIIMRWTNTDKQEVYSIQNTPWTWSELC